MQVGAHLVLGDQLLILRVFQVLIGGDVLFQGQVVPAVPGLPHVVAVGVEPAQVVAAGAVLAVVEQQVLRHDLVLAERPDGIDHAVGVTLPAGFLAEDGAEKGFVLLVSRQADRERFVVGGGLRPLPLRGAAVLSRTLPQGFERRVEVEALAGQPVAQLGRHARNGPFERIGDGVLDAGLDVFEARHELCGGILPDGQEPTPQLVGFLVDQVSGGQQRLPHRVRQAVEQPLDTEQGVAEGLFRAVPGPGPVALDGLPYCLEDLFDGFDQRPQHPRRLIHRVAHDGHYLFEHRQDDVLPRGENELPGFHERLSQRGEQRRGALNHLGDDRPHFFDDGDDDPLERLLREGPEVFHHLAQSHQHGSNGFRGGVEAGAQPLDHGLQLAECLLSHLGELGKPGLHRVEDGPQPHQHRGELGKTERDGVEGVFAGAQRARHLRHDPADPGQGAVELHHDRHGQLAHAAGELLLGQRGLLLRADVIVLDFAQRLDFSAGGRHDQVVERLGLFGFGQGVGGFPETLCQHLVVLADVLSNSN